MTLRCLAAVIHRRRSGSHCFPQRAPEMALPLRKGFTAMDKESAAPQPVLAHPASGDLPDKLLPRIPVHPLREK